MLIGTREAVRSARFTGYQIGGGYAGYAVADKWFCFPIRDCFGDVEATVYPSAGLIGTRAPCDLLGTQTGSA